MFTGLTYGVGRICRRQRQGQDFELTVEADFDWSSPLELGESIAVAGACLTVTTKVGSHGFTALASAETLKCTTLGTATKINLERALALGDRLGGHLVSGHIDGPGLLASINRIGSCFCYKFKVAAELMPLIVPKGSITIDGVSLTVNEVNSDNFTVNLIPHTLQITTLGLLSPGDSVNLETDLLGKYVRRLLNFQNTKETGLTWETLAQNGFR